MQRIARASRFGGRQHGPLTLAPTVWLNWPKVLQDGSNRQPTVKSRMPDRSIQDACKRSTRSFLAAAKDFSHRQH